MAKVKDLKLQGGVNYTAFCYASNAQQDYSFVFNGDQKALLKNLHAHFGLSKMYGPYDVAIYAGGFWQDDGNGGNTEKFSKLSYLKTTSPKCRWNKPHMQCWEDTAGENTIIITPSE